MTTLAAFEGYNCALKNAFITNASSGKYQKQKDNNALGSEIVPIVLHTFSS